MIVSTPLPVLAFNAVAHRVRHSLPLLVGCHFILFHQSCYDGEHHTIHGRCLRSWNILPVPKRLALGTSRGELSEDVPFGIGTIATIATIATIGTIGTIGCIRWII